MDVGARKAALLAMPGRVPNPGATPELRRRTYYHGTQDRFAARVLDRWALEPRSQSGVLTHQPKSWLDPLAGRVYLTPSPERAAGYMELLRHEGKAGPVGLLVEVDGRNLGEVHPDEDDVGLAAYIAGAGSYWKGAGFETALGEAMWRKERGQFPERTPFAQRLVDLSERVLTRNQLEHAMGEWGDLDVSMRAKIGKKLLPHMSDEDQIRIMELGSAIANMGPVPIARAVICPLPVPYPPDFSLCIEVVDAADYAAARRELMGPARGPRAAAAW